MRFVALRSSAIAFGLAVTLCLMSTVSFGQQLSESEKPAASTPPHELGASGSGLGNATPVSPSSDEPAEAEDGPSKQAPEEKGEAGKEENSEPKSDPDAAAAMT